jgi:F-box protein 11
MSYVNVDDKHESGRPTQLRERLSGEVRMQTGAPFDIFQDRKDIAWGQQWQERINQSLDAVTFLIPIITPAFFRSDACRDELERFLKREEELGRGDLILPVYYVSCPVLQDKAKREHDKLAQIIAARQYADWRELRFEELTSPPVRKALAKMAEQIVAALERQQEKPPSPLPEKKSKETGSAANTFNASGGTQSIAQGANSIGTQINNYYTTPPTESKPQPAPEAKIEPPTVVVDAMHRGDYATITEALKAVKAGTRILVRPGLYKEGIVIDKPVEIIGDGEQGDIVIEASGKHTVLFQADNGKVANLTLRQTDRGSWCAVDISQGRLDLEHCDISSKGEACVAICNGADPRLRCNRIHDSNDAGVVVSNNGRGTLEDNEVVANALSGVTIMSGGNPTLCRNRITQHGGMGIWVLNGGGGIFKDNDLRDNVGDAWKIAPDCEARVQRRGNKE